MYKKEAKEDSICRLGMVLFTNLYIHKQKNFKSKDNYMEANSLILSSIEMVVLKKAEIVLSNELHTL